MAARPHVRPLLWAVLLAGALLALPGKAAAEKVLRYAFEISESGFDPALESDSYSSSVLEAIFDAPLTYDYLARPARLVPNTLVEMPEVQDGGATYLLRLRKGIRFTDDPAFGGRPRELTAEDYAYSLKRLADPKNRSPVLFLVEGKIVGLDAVRAEALRTGSFDYSAKVAGLEVLDRSTLRIRLTRPDYTFLYVLATPSLGAVAREVIERNPDTTRQHPVGTGAFRLARYKPSSRIVLERNPDYRMDTYLGRPEDTPEDRATAKALLGKRLPLVDRIEISVIDEQQPRWLAFLGGEQDYIEFVPTEFLQVAMPGGKLAPSLAREGIEAWRVPETELVISAIFNMQDKVVGGYTPARVALRRAISLAYDAPAEATIVRNGQAILAEGVAPPGVAGYDQGFRGVASEYSPARARALLDLFGYVDRDGDGWREGPDGKPLVLEVASPTDAKSKEFDEVWERSMKAVGLRVTFRKEPWPDLVKASRLGKLQIGAFLSWHADYPDAENFYQLLYGPNTGQSNDARFQLPEFDRLYEASRRLPDSPERNELYARMNRLAVAYAPWKFGFHRVRTHMAHPWVRNYKRHPILNQVWKYLDIDPSLLPVHKVAAK